MVGKEIMVNRKSAKKQQRRKKVLGFLILLLLTVAVGVASFSFVTGINPVKPLTANPIIKPSSQDPINILLLGVDAGDGLTRTDTMIVASIDPKTKDVNMISIPRDTKVDMPGSQSSKINAAHAIGGPDKSIEQVEKLLGVPVPYYIKVNFEGFKQMVDLVGGVEINVEKKLRYTDRAGDTYINIPAGLQKLNGQQALNYSRFRHDPLGDLGRVKRQQAFMQALAHEMFKPENILKWPSFIREANKYMETNMGIGELSNLATLAKQMKDLEIHVETIPGEAYYINGASYFIPDAVKLEQLVKEEIFREKSDQATENTENSPSFNPASIRVEVLNGSGTVGLANKLADQLKNKGFQITKVGNADSFNYSETQILDRTGKASLVREIRDLIGASSSSQKVVQDSSNSDITIIIGKNFNR